MTAQQLEEEIVSNLLEHGSYEKAGFKIQNRKSPGVMKVELINLSNDSIIDSLPYYQYLSLVSQMIYYIQTQERK